MQSRIFKYLTTIHLYTKSLPFIHFKNEVIHGVLHNEKVL